MKNSPLATCRAGKEMKPQRALLTVHCTNINGVGGQILWHQLPLHTPMRYGTSLRTRQAAQPPGAASSSCTRTHDATAQRTKVPDVEDIETPQRFLYQTDCMALAYQRPLR